MIPRAKYQELEPQMRNARFPLKKSSRFSDLVMVSPVIEYENGAVCEPLSQIPQAIECWLVDIAVDASKSDLAERRRVGAAPQAL